MEPNRSNSLFVGLDRPVCAIAMHSHLVPRAILWRRRPNDQLNDPSFHPMRIRLQLATTELILNEKDQWARDQVFWKKSPPYDFKTEWVGNWTNLWNQEIWTETGQQWQTLQRRLSFVCPQHQRAHFTAVPNWHIRHELRTASNNNIICTGCDKANASGDCLIGTNTCHCHCVGRCFIAETSGQGSFASNVRRFHLLNHRAINNVIDKLLIDFCFA